jgi:GNAT superfamily N-acetyltransferase
MAGSSPAERSRIIGAEHRQLGRLGPEAARDLATIARLTDLINTVYADAERGLWAAGATRTTTAEITGLVGAGEFAVARLDGEIAACVRIHRLDETTSEFGMLAADPARRGRGLGRDLVRFAEERARTAGDRSMRLELLVPREWRHPSKEFLSAWYTRLGYAVIDTGSIEQAHPHLAPLLVTPCDVLVHEKDLRTPARTGTA